MSLFHGVTGPISSFQMAHVAQCTWNSLTPCTSLITNFNTRSNHGGVTFDTTKLNYRHFTRGNNFSFFTTTRQYTATWSSFPFRNGFVCARASSVILQHVDEDQIPPLSTILQHLKPPAGVSPYADEANRIVSNLTSTWGLKPDALKRYEVFKAVGIISCKHMFPKTVSAQRLAAVSLLFGVLFLLDDICFDCSNSSSSVLCVEDFGLDPSIWQDKLKMERFWERLKNIFISPEMHSNLTAIEKSVWDAGRLLRSLSPSETWFLAFAENIQEIPLASIDFRVRAASILINVQEIEACTELLIQMSGMRCTCDLIELTANAFMSAEAKNDPQIRRLTYLCSRHVSLSNSFFSYAKEVSSQQKPVANHIQLMMDHQSMSFQQAVRRVVDMILAESIEFLEIEQDPHVLHLISVDDGLRSYMEGLKYMYGGCFEFQITDERYKSFNSPFPELRLLKSIQAK